MVQAAPPPSPNHADKVVRTLPLRRAILKPNTREARKKVCILEETWRLVDKRVSARQDPARYQAHIWILGCAINASLKEERHRRIEEAGEGCERFLGADPPLH